MKRENEENKLVRARSSSGSRNDCKGSGRPQIDATTKGSGGRIQGGEQQHTADEGIIIAIIKRSES